MGDIQTSIIIMSITVCVGLLVLYINKHKMPDEPETTTEKIDELLQIYRQLDKRIAKLVSYPARLGLG